jgi:hypothetical protein
LFERRAELLLFEAVEAQFYQVGELRGARD